MDYKYFIICGFLTFVIIIFKVIISKTNTEIYILNSKNKFKNNSNELQNERLKDLHRVSKIYRWLGLILSFILFVTFMIILVISYFDRLSLWTCVCVVFETYIFFIIKKIYKQVQFYETLLQNEQI